MNLDPEYNRESATHQKKHINDVYNHLDKKIRCFSTKLHLQRINGFVSYSYSTSRNVYKDLNRHFLIRS